MKAALDYAMRSVFGAWILARRDGAVAAPAYFDLTMGGFWRSFLAPLGLLPLHFLTVAVQHVDEESLEPALLSGGLAYLAFIALWPLLMIPVARTFGLGAHYVTYIIAYNWATIVIMAFVLPASALIAMLPGQAGGLIALALLVGSLAYVWVVTRRMLQAPPGLAFAVIVLDLLLTLALDGAMDRLVS